ncbi:hypothetical protein L596_014921 [Steinernema carpocapsae]|uniref:PA domain-containing protein n=1 Tax=Steinernema carpocapsae TaxID=34508 RepID=A0A4U5NEA5_STECR|nr:hypothetical protein L596_014921 [Steinernema carpocapsae]
MARELNAESEVMARAGIVFMEEFKDFAALYDTAANKQPKRIVQVISEPHLGALYFSAAPSNFGSDLSYVDAELVLAMPLDACSPLSNGHEVPGKIVVVLRSKCMFQEKARHAQNNGATGVIILDNNPGSNFDPFFAMSGGESDDPSDIRIPVVMLFNLDGKTLLRQVKEFASLRVRVAELVGNPAYFFEQFLRNPTEFSRPDLRAIDMSSQNPIALNVISKNIEFRFHFAEVNAESLAQQKQRIVEDNIEVLSECTQIAKPSDKEFLLNVARTLAYGELGFDVTVSADSFQRMSALLPKISVSADMKKLRLPVVTVKCSLDDSTPKCNRL